MTAAAALRALMRPGMRPGMRLVGPLPLMGSCVGLWIAPEGDVQLAIWDEGWPEGAPGSRAQPSLTRFAGPETPGELAAIAAALTDAMEGTHAGND
jgi:hypothetical protein